MSCGDRREMVLSNGLLFRRNVNETDLADFASAMAFHGRGHEGRFSDGLYQMFRALKCFNHWRVERVY